MGAKPLSQKELAWLEQLEAVMSKCPSKRLSCFTIGDSDLHFYDKNVSREWERENPNEQLDANELHNRADSSLYVVTANFTIDSCQN